MKGASPVSPNDADPLRPVGLLVALTPLAWLAGAL